MFKRFSISFDHAGFVWLQSRKACQLWKMTHQPFRKPTRCWANFQCTSSSDYVSAEIQCDVLPALCMVKASLSYYLSTFPTLLMHVLVTPKQNKTRSLKFLLRKQWEMGIEMPEGWWVDWREPLRIRKLNDKHPPSHAHSWTRALWTWKKAAFSITDMNQNSLCGLTESRQLPSSNQSTLPLWDIHFGVASNLLWFTGRPELTFGFY